MSSVEAQSRALITEKVAIQEKSPPVVRMYREGFKSTQVDREVFDEIRRIRDDVESIEKWKETKELAKRELEGVPSNILGLLLKKAAPFIESMPASHSKGHVARDLVHLTELFQVLPPEDMDSYDDVELIVAVLGGVFHDIGNAVVDRYTERERLTGHAEVGAYLFGVIASGLLPPSLTKLTQFAIAAHTNYDQPIPVPIHNPITKRMPYNATIVAGNKLGLRDTRNADRLEIRSIINLVRYVISVAEPVEIFSGGVFLEPHTNARKEFKAKFAREPSNSKTMLGFHKQLTEDVDQKTWHTRDDTKEMTQMLFTPRANQIQRFIHAVMDKIPKGWDREENREKAFSKFLQLCLLLEPGIDIQYKLKLLQEKFHWLSEEEQAHWAYGFSVLTDELYPELYNQMQARISTVPAFVQQRGDTIKHIFKELQERAQRVLDVENPKLLGTDLQQAPDVLDVLIS